MKLNLSTCLLAFRLTINTRSILYTTLFTCLFILLASILVNIQNVVSVSSAPYSLFVKIKLLFYIIFGIFSALSSMDDWFLLVTAILFGVNMGIVLSKLSLMRKQGKLGFVFGAGAVSLVSAGCAACGLSVLSLVGLGSVLAILPFHGIEFYILSIAVLLWSLYINLGAYAKACKIN